MSNVRDNQDSKPAVRFKGFSDAWEKRYLGDYVVDYTEKTTQENQFPVLTSSQQQGIVLQSEYFSDRQVTTDENIGYFVLPRGYFTYRSRSDNNIFVFNRNDIIDKGIISYFYPVFGLINVDSNFFLRRINNGLNRQLAIAAEGTGQHVLSLKKFKKMETRFPSLPEQKQIGEFLECLDDLITVNQRKAENLQKLKKSLLQQMFVSGNDSVPKIRFAGFADAWEQRKLGDVVGEIQSGNRLPKDSLTSGNIPYVVAQTKNEGVFKTISEKTLDYNGNPMKLFPGNSISFSIDNPEAMFYRSTEFYTSNIMRVIHADYLSHQQYLFILENMKSFTRRYDWSHKFSGPVVSNLEYLQPNEQEQCKIGSFILAFDNIIALHQRKVENLQKLKKSLLHLMFI